MRVLFMGTPGFACATLEALVAAGHEVVGVVTRPDKAAGRGRKLAEPPVKVVARERGLNLLQPARVNAPESLAVLRDLKPDVLVVAAFGAILRKPLLDLAPRGAVNVHASLLPAYRGVAPVPWCLIHGHRTTGVTTLAMDAGVDTGPTLLRRPVDISPLETAGALLERLGRLGGALLVETLAGLEAGTLRPVAQPDEGATYAPKLEKSHGYLDLTRPAAALHDQFRGTTPAPGTRVFLGDDPVLVRLLRPVPEVEAEPYRVVDVASRHLRIGTGSGSLDLIEVRPAGRKDMDGAAFARGRRLVPGDRLSPPPRLADLEPMIVVPR